jgi:hypothetical protein
MAAHPHRRTDITMTIDERRSCALVDRKLGPHA